MTDELTKALAEATDSTVEEIEQGAKKIEMAPPWEAEVVELDEDASPKRALGENDG